MSMDRWRKRALKAEHDLAEQRQIVAGLRRDLIDARAKAAKRDEKVAA